MKLFLSGGPRLPFGFRLGVLFDPRELWRARAPQGAAPTGSFLYVIQDNLGNCKIGVSRDPIQRMRELQTGHPERLELAWCAVTPGSGYAIEALAKRTTEHLCASGEWRRATPWVMAEFLTRSAQVLGEPLQSVPPRMVPQILEVARSSGPPAVPAAFPYAHPFLSVLALSCLFGLVVFLSAH